MKKPDFRLESALAELRRLVEEIVREEQLRDWLTELPNGLALSEALKTAIEEAESFWCALIEVDYFKRINDKFTYEVADGLLQKIAERLKLFTLEVPSTIPVRAHGDEFYLLGQSASAEDGNQLMLALDRVREDIANIVVPTDRGNMSCTVSIGFMTVDDADDEVLTERVVMRMVEAAVGAAKIKGRNSVVRYSASAEKMERTHVRDDCSSCGASFTVEIPTQIRENGGLFCPNCGKRRPRPGLDAIGSAQFTVI